MLICKTWTGFSHIELDPQKMHCSHSEGDDRRGKRRAKGERICSSEESGKVPGKKESDGAGVSIRKKNNKGL